MGNDQSGGEVRCRYRIGHELLSDVELDGQGLTMSMQVQCSRQQLARWQQQLQLVSRLQPQHLLLPISTDYQRAGNGENCVAILRYPCYPYVLREQIENRHKIGKWFEEDELWYLLWVLINNLYILNTYHSNNNMHDSNNKYKYSGRRIDIQPYNIVFDENGSAKLITALTSPQLSTLHRTVPHQHFPAFLTRQQIQYINNNNNNINNNNNTNTNNNINNIYNIYNTNTNNSNNNNNNKYNIYNGYSIGLSMLCAIHVQDMSQLYSCSKDGKIVLDERLLQQKVSGMQHSKNSKYSAQLITIVTALCNCNNYSTHNNIFNNVLDVLDIRNLLLPVCDDILQFRQFTLTNHQLYNRILKHATHSNTKHITSLPINSNSKYKQYNHNINSKVLDSSPVKQLDSIAQSPRYVLSNLVSEHNTHRNTPTKHIAHSQNSVRCASSIASNINIYTDLRSQHAGSNLLAAYHPAQIQRHIEDHNRIYTTNYINNVHAITMPTPIAIPTHPHISRTHKSSTYDRVPPSSTPLTVSYLNTTQNIKPYQTPQYDHNLNTNKVHALKIESQSKIQYNKSFQQAVGRPSSPISKLKSNPNNYDKLVTLGDDDDLIERVNQQLIKSKLLFPS